MAIQRKPKVTETTATKAAEDAFIQGAPDAQAQASTEPETYEKGIKKGNRRQITLTIPPDLLRRVDEAAARSGQARAALINLAIYRALEGDVFES